MKQKCENLCASCRNRCIVEYYHTIDVTHHKHGKIAQLWYDFKEACRQFFHNTRYSKNITGLTIEHVDFSEKHTSTVYHYTYRPFSVCNCSKRLEEMTEFNPKKWISYFQLKRQFEIKKHATCGFYKNKGAMNPKQFEFKYRTFVDN